MSDQKISAEELAKLAYHAYGSVTDFKNYQGLPMPEWENLTPKIQEAWQAAVLEVLVSWRERMGFVRARG